MSHSQALSSVIVALTFIYLFIYLCLFRIAPRAYGSSQARVRIWVTPAGLHHSHSNTSSEPRLQPGNTRSFSPPSKARIEPMSSWILVEFITAEPQWELLASPYFSLELSCEVTGLEYLLSSGCGMSQEGHGKLHPLHLASDTNICALLMSWVHASQPSFFVLQTLSPDQETHSPCAGLQICGHAIRGSNSSLPREELCVISHLLCVGSQGQRPWPDSLCTQFHVDLSYSIGCTEVFLLVSCQFSVRIVPHLDISIFLMYSWWVLHPPTLPCWSDLRISFNESEAVFPMVCKILSYSGNKLPLSDITLSEIFACLFICFPRNYFQEFILTSSGFNVSTYLESQGCCMQRKWLGIKH